MPTKQPSAKYLARAAAFAEAVDIGLAIAGTLSEDISATQWEDTYRNPALAPEPPFANLRSLAYLEDAFFTYWNEASGEHIERFWQLLAERDLPFERKDIVRGVLSRGRINSDIEYQQVVDALVIQEEMGKISRAEAEKLSAMLGRFERRAISRTKLRSDRSSEP